MLQLTDVLQPLTADQIFAKMLVYLQGIGQVVQTGVTGTAPVGTGNIAPSGPPSIAFSCVVQITTTGALNSGVFSLSLDGGNTFPITGVTIPATGSYVIANTGVTLVFTNGTYNATTSFIQGETYAFNSTLPTFPVTDWETGGVARTMLYAEAVAISDLTKTMQNMAAGGLTAYATRGWADLLAQSFYNLQRQAGSQAQGVITLTQAATGIATPVNPGQLTFRTAGGLLYSNTTSTTTVPGGPTTVSVTAAAIGKLYNQAENTITTLVTPIPGVSCNNGLNLGQVFHAGTGAGTAVATGTPIAKQVIIAQIVTTGAAGTATFQYSVNGGIVFSPVITLPAGAYPVPSTGVTFTFAGSFTSGDTYTLSTGWLTSNGTDAETDSNLLNRCISQWSTLAAPSPTNAYVAWAKTASQEVSLVYVTPDTTTPGVVDIVLGSLGGGVSAAAISAVQNYILPRVPITVTPRTSSVSQINVTVSATVYVHTAYLATVQAAVTSAFSALPAQLGIGGTVYFSAIETLLQSNVGVRNVELLTLNGTVSDVGVATTQIAQLINSITYIAI